MTANTKGAEMNFKLYYAAIDADAEYQARLNEVFGANASNARYTREGHEHPVCAEAFRAWRKAMNAWLNEVGLQRAIS
jgi:hypothetical protein